MIIQYISPEQEKFDKALTDLARKCTLLKSIWPINATEECQKFIECKGKYNPQFVYKKIDINAIQQTINGLKKIQEEAVATDPISQLQTKKIQELIEKYSLILAYQQQDFDNIYLYNTRLFESIPFDVNIPLPQHVLQQSISDYLGTEKYDKFTRIDSALAKEIIHHKCKKLEIDQYKIVEKHLGAENMSVNLQDVIHINLNTRKLFNTKTFIALLSHELDGHVKRYHNGCKSGIYIIKNGTAYHDITEEGVATYYQAQISGGEIRYQNTDFMRKKCRQGMSMDRIQLCTWIRDMRNIDIEKSFWIALRVKRGIQDTSTIHGGTICQYDRIYLEGWYKVDQYLDTNISIDRLMFGKIAIDDLDMCRDIFVGL